MLVGSYMRGFTVLHTYAVRSRLVHDIIGQKYSRFMDEFLLPRTP